MYHLVRFLKRNTPKRWVLENEMKLRKVYGKLFVAKGEHYCSVCTQKLKLFVCLENNELVCPICGSGKRHRRLFSILKEQVGADERILDFSPNVGFAHYAKKRWGANYFTSTFDEKEIADYHLDITNIDLPDNGFDLVVCYHVLEHIIEDVKAMRELLRILKPGGSCMIQTPFKAGEIYEDYSITDPKDRLAHFHQEDHVRIYSVSGIEERLRQVGFDVKLHSYLLNENTSEIQKLGYKDEEYIVEARKPV